MAAFSLIPRETRFFDDFVALAEQIRAGARTLKQMVAGEAPDLSKADEIKEIEHACDRTTRAIIDRLNRTFVTPLDREDIHELICRIDDILDEGHTLSAIREKLLAAGAAEVYSTVFAEKDTGRAKPIRADFVGIVVPNRYVFGFGMDVYSVWRNLPAIYALKES